MAEFASVSWPKLQKLSFACTELDEEGAELLAKSHLPQLRILNLSECGLTPPALSEIILGRWTKLEHVFVGCEKCSAAELAVLRGTSRKVLYAGENHVLGCTRLAAGRWPALHVLDLSNSFHNSDAFYALQ